MYQIDRRGNIVLPRGDTLLISVPMPCARFPPRTAAVFGIRARGEADGGAALRKAFRVTESAQGKQRVIVYLSNADTRGIAPGEYVWDLRIVTDPEYDADGNVRCEDAGDSVTSLFAGRAQGMPTLTIVEVGVDV